MVRPFRLRLAAFVLGAGLAFSGHAETAPRPNEIIVSGANYAETPPEELAKMFRHPADLTEAPPLPAGERPLRYYQFLPGETLEADLTYVEVCQLLIPVLAEKNLRTSLDLARIELILRVTYGGRRWRDPFVRKDNLEWRHGLVPKRPGASLSAGQAWDDRAGGDESALYQLERDLSDLNPTGGAEGMADRLIGGTPTSDYYLIVVDAFEAAALKAKGNKAPRVWSTFIAVPRQKGVKFSDVAAQMVAKAGPYFGETLPGKVRFIDREVSVKLGDLKILEDNVTVPKQ